MAKDTLTAPGVEHALDELLHRMVRDILGERDLRRLDLEAVISRKESLSLDGRRDAATALRSIGDRFVRYADMLELE